jgi:hypothetical protein
MSYIYDGRLNSSWTHLITPSQKFVEVLWQSLFRSTSLGKGCTSYNAPPTTRKRAADRLPQASGGASEPPFHGRKNGNGSESGSVEPHYNFRHTVQTCLMWFLGFSNHEKGAPRQEISKLSTVCSTFSRNGWSVVRSASLAKGGT